MILKITLNNVRNSAGITILNLKLYYRAIIINKNKNKQTKTLTGVTTDKKTNGIELKTQK